jgi:hypothetical protein
MLITVVPIGRADGLIAGIRRLLEDRSGVFFVSEVTCQPAGLLRLIGVRD